METGSSGCLGRRWGAYGGAGAPRSVHRLVDDRSVRLLPDRQSAGTREQWHPAIRREPAYWRAPTRPVTSHSNEVDFYRVVIQTGGLHTFETSGFNGAYCSFGLELNTNLQLFDAGGNRAGHRRSTTLTRR